MLIVIENLLTRDEVLAMRERLVAADWQDGAGTAGTRSVAVKQNLQLPRQDALARELGTIILRKLGQHPEFLSAALMRLPEADLTIRSDLSATLFLSDPDSYEGGELIVEEQFGAQAVKLAAGDMVLYPSSSLHQVAPVTSGQRICAITWLQSAVADTSARALLYDLDQSIRALTPDRTKDDPEINRLIHVYHNLLRRWAQP